MATDLALQSQPKPISVLPPWLASSVSAMTTSYPPRIPADRILSIPQRREVSAMVADCERSLAPAARREIGSAVMRLLADYPADGASAAIEDARSANWIEALEGLPAWAIDEARRRWVRGQVPGVNPDFAPKPARIRQIATAAMSPVYERRSKLTLLLRAVPDERPVSDEERARVAEKFRQFQHELGATVEAASMRSPNPENNDTKAA